jgi:anthranilate phosphoribosyltransferase
MIEALSDRIGELKSVHPIAKELRAVVETGRILTVEETAAAVTAILDGEANSIQTAALLASLRARGESPSEIEGCVRAMLRRIEVIRLGDIRAIDIVGTGGDRAGTFNISTTAALVVAAAGTPVLKHGGRRVTSSVGSVDFIEALGIRPCSQPNPRHVLRCVARFGFAFLPTPVFHRFPPRLTELRQMLGIRTLFNLAGPIAHPAQIHGQVIGVAMPAHVEILADVLLRLGRVHAFVVHGTDGLDEVSPVGPTKVAEIVNGSVRTYTVTPEDFGLSRVSLDSLRGGAALDNAQISTAVLTGERGPRRNAVLLSAAFGLVAADRTASLQDGLNMASAAIDSGRTLRLLEDLRGDNLAPAEVSSELHA